MIFVMRPKELVCKLQGIEKLFAFKSKVVLPAKSIERIEYSVGKKPNLNGIWYYLRFPGTGLPGIICAGRFIKKDSTEFWYLVFHKHGILTITLKKGQAPYDKVRLTVPTKLAADVISWWDGR